MARPQAHGVAEGQGGGYAQGFFGIIPEAVEQILHHRLLSAGQVQEIQRDARVHHSQNHCRQQQQPVEEDGHGNGGIPGACHGIDGGHCVARHIVDDEPCEPGNQVAQAKDPDCAAVPALQPVLCQVLQFVVFHILLHILLCVSLKVFRYEPAACGVRVASHSVIQVHARVFRVVGAL